MVDFVTAIMLHGGADVVTVKAMRSKGTTLRGSLMINDLGAWNREGGSVEIKISEETGVGRQLGLPS